jgi:hypothetical protein
VSDHTGQCFFLAPNASESADGSDWIKLLEGIVKDDMLAARYKSVLLPKLQSGSTFTKKNFSTLGAMSTRDQNRVVSVSMDCRSIMWHKPELAEFDAIQFKDIINVVAGAETQVFKRQRKAVDVACCFSVVTKKRTLDLVTSNTTERDLWVEGLRAVRKFGSILTDEKLEQLTWEKRARYITEKRRKDERREGLMALIKRHQPQIKGGSVEGRS